jgi:hypothetical protein
MRNGKSDSLAMDNLTYRYETNPITGAKINNRLLLVNDAVHPREYNTDVDDQGVFVPSDTTTWNYQYDAQGNLITDKAEGVKNISWTVN